MLRSVAVLVVTAALSLVLTASAQAAKGVKKNSEHTAHGTVVAVDNMNGAGFITIKAHQAKKKIQAGKKAGKAHEHKFLVSTGTRFEFKHGLQTRPAAFTDVKPGEHIAILAKGDQAELVAIAKHNAKKNK